MADDGQIRIIKSGVKAWNAWRRRSGELRTRVDLSRADLTEAKLLLGADLAFADLTGANLSGANLTEADLREANLSGANLSGANLTEAVLLMANLSGAGLDGANLAHANLAHADLRQTNLTEADLTEANLSNALLSGTVLGNASLLNTRGLDSCRYLGPSILDHRTLMQSGPLPLAFLRGCGLPDSLIDYLPSLLEAAVQFYSCFISYSTQDQEFATRLYADLQDKGVRCWFAPHDIHSGKKIHEQIDAAIHIYQAAANPFGRQHEKRVGENRDRTCAA